MAGVNHVFLHAAAKEALWYSTPGGKEEELILGLAKKIYNCFLKKHLL